MIRYYGESNVPGAPGQAAPSSAVRFNPAQLNVQPGPGYFQNPGYSPFLQDQDRDRFILHDPRSGVAGGNFMGGQGSQINPETFKKDARQQKIYNKGMGTDNPNEKEIFLRRTGPQLPLAQGTPGMMPMGNAGVFVDNAQMFMGPQFGQIPAGFQNKFVS
jgi:hypothetical protein